MDILSTETAEETSQRYKISASTRRRIIKFYKVLLEENDAKQFQIYSKFCDSYTIMKLIKLFLVLINNFFTLNSLREHIIDKLRVQIKLHIIRRLQRDRIIKKIQEEIL